MYRGPHRVFVPHSPLDLELGHRVRIMLPSGRISTGTIRYLGHLQGEADLHLGVELQTPDHELHDGSLGGHSYFEWLRISAASFSAFITCGNISMTVSTCCGLKMACSFLRSSDLCGSYAAEGDCCRPQERYCWPS
ncbi:hypothetical protein EYF80_000418 [Liparis tanakae]|uniref:CAP-Gly domain-containing protein n=1 Tax=Liparis tanakae TaxID=230148 RepID=A0A4Z2JG27_9TELE|nr:hypothetical protein EYF80_000418 [Liparis tanakae]